MILYNLKIKPLVNNFHLDIIHSTIYSENKGFVRTETNIVEYYLHFQPLLAQNKY